jgi:pyridoxine 5-phosphate synthase
MIRLGINIDHVATVRQARGEAYPDPVQAAVFAELGGADNITCHLREDRRHVQDRDVRLLRQTIKIPLNFEMAVTKEMLGIAAEIKPASVTLVPEKREERTTEGGMDLSADAAGKKDAIKKLKDAGILVSLFIEPDEKAVEQTAKLGAEAVEFHTGTFCHQIDAAVKTLDKLVLVRKLAKVSRAAAAAGLQVHFGHGLHYANASWLQLIPEAEEANIGHAVVGRAIFVGLEKAVREMKELLTNPANKPWPSL